MAAYNQAMPHIFPALPAALLALACCSGAAAQEAPVHDTVRFVTFENDLYFHTDRYYTNGIQFSVKHSRDERGEWARAYARRLCAMIGCEDASLLSSQTNFGQLMYTPQNISIRENQPNDRPWAGLLYYEQVWSLLSPDHRTLTTLTAEMGVTGRLSLAEQSQKLVHDIIERHPPQGWDNQIGGSLGVMATAEIRTARESLSTTLWRDVQLNTATYWRIGAGNIQTYLAGGVAVVIGKDLPPVSPPPPGIGNKSRDSSRALPAATACLKVWVQCTLFGSIEARLMAYSVFLDGRLFHDDPDVQRRAFVTDMVLGMRLDFPNTRSQHHGPWFAQLKLTRRSPEFRSNFEVPHHRVGALTIGTEF
jgi:lipid A 3-O-deacylase